MNCLRIRTHKLVFKWRGEVHTNNNIYLYTVFKTLGERDILHFVTMEEVCICVIYFVVVNKCRIVLKHCQH